jgi:hypothetical protein
MTANATHSSHLSLAASASTHNAALRLTTSMLRAANCDDAESNLIEYTRAVQTLQHGQAKFAHAMSVGADAPAIYDEGAARVLAAAREGSDLRALSALMTEIDKLTAASTVARVPK